MLERYLAIINYSGAPLERLSSGFLAASGFQSFLLGKCCALLTTCAAQLLRLPTDGGAVIGPVFPRHGPAACILPSDKLFADDMLHGDPFATLAERYWGGYVAVLTPKNRMLVARSPGGALPCYFTMFPGGWAISSDIMLLVEAGLVRPSVNWAEIPRYLGARDLPQARTAVDGVTELLPGTAVELGEREARVWQFWNPWDFVSEPLLWDSEDVADRLRRTVDHCVASWASTSQAPILTLSGGLDSSIVAAALSRVGGRASSVTISTLSRDGDERDYARVMAQASGMNLIEATYDLADVDLSRSVAEHFPKPIGFVHELAYHSALLRAVGEAGADAVFTGNGGDNVFYNSSSVRPFFDACKARGFHRETAQSIADIGRVTQVPRWEVCRQIVKAARTMRRPYQWHLDIDFMEADAAEAMRANPPQHDWLERASLTRPGKLGHIALLLRVQNHVEGYLRGFGLPMIDPLMSQPIVELALAIPTWKMIEGGSNRAIARRAYADLLPPLIRDRRRKGSPSSFAVDLVNQRLDEIRERLMDGELAQHRLISRSALDKALVSGPAIDRHYVRLMALLDMEAWIRRWQAIPKGQGHHAPGFASV